MISSRKKILTIDKIRKILDYEPSIKTLKVKVSDSRNKSVSPHSNPFLFPVKGTINQGPPQYLIVGMKENFGNERLLITNDFLKMLFHFQKLLLMSWCQNRSQNRICGIKMENLFSFSQKMILEIIYIMQPCLKITILK